MDVQGCCWVDWSPGEGGKLNSQQGADEKENSWWWNRQLVANRLYSGALDLVSMPSNYQIHHDLLERMVLWVLLCVKESRIKNYLKMLKNKQTKKHVNCRFMCRFEVSTKPGGTSGVRSELHIYILGYTSLSRPKAQRSVTWANIAILAILQCPVRETDSQTDRHSGAFMEYSSQ